MYVSLLVWLLPYWNWTNIGISPFFGEISFWFYIKHSLDFVTLVPNFSEFPLCPSVSLLAYVLKRPSFGNLKDQRGLQASLLPQWVATISSSYQPYNKLSYCTLGKFGSLYLSLFTYWLTKFLPFSGKKMVKSVNIDIRTLKFGL